MLTKLKPLYPLAWILPAMLAFGAYDRALDTVYARHIVQSTAVTSRAGLEQALSNEIVVLGDSCARYAIDVGLVSKKLGRESYNLATFSPGLPGQISLVLRALEQGHHFDALVTMGTEDFATWRKRDTHKVTRQYYASLTAMELLWEERQLPVDEAVPLLWAMMSPSYAAGRGLGDFVFGSLRHRYRDGSWAEVEERRRANQHLLRVLRKSRGQTREKHKTASKRVKQGVDKIVKHRLDRERYRWNPDSIGGFYERLVAEADARNIPVFHAFCPREDTITGHENWKQNFEQPTRQWARSLEKHYPSFRYWMPKRMTFKHEDFANTRSHLRVPAARKVTKALIKAMKKELR